MLFSFGSAAGAAHRLSAGPVVATEDWREEDGVSTGVVEAETGKVCLVSKALFDRGRKHFPKLIK